LTLTQVFGAITFYLENELLLTLIECANSSVSMPRGGTRNPFPRTCASVSMPRGNNFIPGTRVWARQ
jgi:hypothetical protein